MFKHFKKILSDFRGGASKIEIYLGILLGFAIGFIPDWNFITVACFIIFFFTRANATVWVLSSALGKLLTFLFAAPINQFGKILINHGLDGFVKAVYQTPVLSFSNLHYYNVLGAFVIWFLLAVTIFPILTKVMMKALNRVDEGIEKASNKNRLFIGSVLSFVFGNKDNTKKSFFLKGRIIILTVLALIILLPAKFYSQSYAKKTVTKMLEAATSNEVAIRKLNISYLSGKLTIKDLELYEHHKPNNVLLAENITADFSVLDALRRRLVIDNVNITKLELDQPKSAIDEGRLTKAPKKRVKKKKADKKDDDKEHNYKDYLSAAQKVTKFVTKLKSFLNSDQKDKPESTKDKYKDQKNKKYFDEKCRACIAKHSDWVIKEVNVTELFISDKAPTFFLNAYDISSKPSLYGKKPNIKFDIDEATKAKFKNKINDKVGTFLKKLF